MSSLPPMGRTTAINLGLDRLQKKARKRDLEQLPAEYEGWLRYLFPQYVGHPFAERHDSLWRWFWNLRSYRRPRPFVAIWPRAGGKSTSVELGVVRVGAERVRDYVWYCCGVQDQADKHISTIGALLESPIIAHHYPDLGTRQVGKYGNVRGWRRNRLWTRAGLVIDGIGLDTAARGARIEENRPGLIIFDDIDDKYDSLKVTEKKQGIMTSSILPAGNDHCAVLFVQNLITPTSIASKLASDKPEFLTDRILSGPHPAVDGLTYEAVDFGRYKITAGTPTWEGQSIEICEDQLATWGPIAFEQEAQHDVDIILGGLFESIEFRRCSWEEVPDLVTTTVWVDPAVSSTDKSDSMGIQVDGIGEDEIVYRLWSFEQITTPLTAMKLAIQKGIEFKCLHIGVETDQGGDAWISVYNEAVRELKEAGMIADLVPAFTWAKAGAGHGNKAHRASLMMTDYERGKIVHVLGTHQALERALKRFPIRKPFDLTDAAYWSWHYLKKGAGGWSRGSA